MRIAAISCRCGCAHTLTRVWDTQWSGPRFYDCTLQYQTCSQPLATRCKSALGICRGSRKRPTIKAVFVSLLSGDTKPGLVW
ncbi:hypothetical protein IF1G_06354 [Cordyceps javanica]|uniref:Uncharacterized protein n=1 Tax=Cordyceps javanica TaxID=43265 RepID=A0A545VLA2_9HYPO|nr:hypothetical protein IF1G_06354 [Cordyceps javanica]TQW02513.1 hypothetical protein IF2G_09904 [Cordyceps javanica]